MQSIDTTASFNENGELTIDILPIIKNQKVKLLILLEENDQNEWYQYPGKRFSAAYPKYEPSYTLNMHIEPNPDYKL